MTEGFAHQLRLDQIGGGERLDLVADDEERLEIQRRLGLESLDRLEAHVALGRDGERIEAEGRLTASLGQSCVVTGDPVAAHVDQPFRLVFVPESQAGEADDEIELRAEDCDVVFYEGGKIDLGSAIADTLALSLDPYPRSAGAQAALKEAGVLSEAETGPFAALAKLRKGDDS